MSDKDKSRNSRSMERRANKSPQEDRDASPSASPNVNSNRRSNESGSHHSGASLLDKPHVNSTSNAVKNSRQRNTGPHHYSHDGPAPLSTSTSYPASTTAGKSNSNNVASIATTSSSPNTTLSSNSAAASISSSNAGTSSDVGNVASNNVCNNNQTESASDSSSPSNFHRSRETASTVTSGALRNHSSQRRRRVQSECDLTTPELDMDVEEALCGIYRLEEPVLAESLAGVTDVDAPLRAEKNATSGKEEDDVPMASDSAVPSGDPQASPSPNSGTQANNVTSGSQHTAMQVAAPQQPTHPQHPQPNAQSIQQAGNHHCNQSLAYNWQASKTTIRDRLGYIFNSENMADVYFIVGRGNQQRIPAHKFVLSIGSAVFDAMFNGGMATTSNEVELPDIEASAFLSLLKFLYTDQVNIGPETVMTTLYTAKKYAVPALEKACVDFLKKNLCSDNAFMLLTQARLFDEPQLAALCLETIDKNTTEALAADGFTDIDLETLYVVLERDTLGIREYKLFKFVARWAEAECNRRSLPNNAENQRDVLGRALRFVRFPIMTVEEFAGGPAQSGLLSDREVVQLFLYFTVNPKPHVGFNDAPRCCLTGKEQVVSRFQQIESRWGYSGTCDRIRFVVNRKIFVVGFGLYGSIHGCAEYSVNIQIIQTDYGKVCGQNDATFQCDGSASTFRVMFKEPVEILPNQNHTACATLKGPDSYYGTKGLRKVTHESLNSGKVTFMFTYAAGNNNGTSVEDGQIPEIIFYT